MKELIRLFLSCSFVLVVLLSHAQKKVILDTDPSYDPDDAGCMAMLHAMANQGECYILAVINSTNHKESPIAISAINHFFNRGAIPVGDYKGYAEKIDAPGDTYDGLVAKNYPAPVKSWEEARDGVSLYREILAAAKEKSITVVIIGTMHNFYGLLQSGPDRNSTLTGKELVKEKVAEVVTMGGNFIDGKGLDRTNWGGAEELCSYTDWSCVKEERNAMCRYVIENCQAPFIASGWEVGCGDYYNAEYGNVITGQGLKGLAEDHIIRKSYEFHFQFRGGAEDISRHSNDQCALHYAIRGEANNYVAVKNGKISLSEKGVCAWSEQAGGVQGYIQKNRDKELIAEEIEALMLADTPEPVTQAPIAPANFKAEKKVDHMTVSWDHSKASNDGSWVIGYDVFVSGALQSRVHGNQFHGKLSEKELATLEVRSVNASGTVSAPTKFSDRP
ncbi:MAG: nucleoside hydrolase [Cytophagales bacterium]|nr:nucleoside hydrolase [Cytophagales bacterium]